MNTPTPPRKIDWADYELRVAALALEAEGISRGDAQGIVDAEMMQQPEPKEV